MEIMGLHLPGSSFVNPNTPLRDALTKLGVKRAMEITALGNHFTPIGHVIDERAIVNGVVGLHATGGSTNLTIHLVAMAAAAGIALMGGLLRPRGSYAAAHPHLSERQGRREPFPRRRRHGLSDPRIARRRARARRRADHLGRALADYPAEPRLGADGEVSWVESPKESGDASVLRAAKEPFQPTGGLKVLEGPLGRAVIKTSAVAPERHMIEAPARVFHSQEELHAAFRAGELDRDMVAVVRFQGPKAIGMPELHKLMPPLGVLQDRGHRIALVTDGRLSGASGKVPSAIHVTPEAAAGGAIAKIRDGDMIRLDAAAGRLEVKVAPDEWSKRAPETYTCPLPISAWGASCSASSAVKPAPRTRGRRCSPRRDSRKRLGTLKLCSSLASLLNPRGLRTERVIMSRLWLAVAFIAAAGVTSTHAADGLISVTLDQAKSRGCRPAPRR